MGIADQRTIHFQGGATIDDQRAYWTEALRGRGLTVKMDRRTLIAYISDGRWVASCPNCNGGIACWDQNPHGCCLCCGHCYPIEFPDGYKDAELLLAGRRPTEQHWEAHLGETVRDLELEATDLIPWRVRRRVEAGEVTVVHVKDLA